jgi:hypothetical protein
MCNPCDYGRYDDVECSDNRKSYAGQNDDMPAENDSTGRL